ncbi:tRNA nucleotidyltransferase [Methylocella sp.]|uniref:tRNA nucleotidyltransferase n=1 Tax=Methylocella sp. TaxID=1978226 RepID=UPI00378465BC
MNHEPNFLPPDLAQTRPGLGVLRMAALFAESAGEPDDDALEAMFDQTERGALGRVAPAEMWPELVRGLMAPFPSRMIRALRDSGALEVALPEADALYGVPQIADDPAGVDLGEHLQNALDEAARRDAPLPVRFALLVMNFGKSDSPPEHLPAHYRHIERGRPRIEDVAARFGAPHDCRELALLTLAECERVHRASEVRAGPVAMMLERLGAFDAPGLYDALLQACACDYGAYPGRAGQPYPKAALLETARAACAEIDENALRAGLDAEKALEATRAARAAAIAKAFRSQRWSA